MNRHFRARCIKLPHILVAGAVTVGKTYDFREDSYPANNYNYNDDNGRSLNINWNQFKNHFMELAPNMGTVANYGQMTVQSSISVKYLLARYVEHSKGIHTLTLNKIYKVKELQVGDVYGYDLIDDIGLDMSMDLYDFTKSFSIVTEEDRAEALRVTCLCCGNKPKDLEQVELEGKIGVLSICCGHREEKQFYAAEIRVINEQGGWTAFLS